MSQLFQHISQSIRRPDHWVYASWLDTVTKYRKTRLGILWMLVPTAVYIWGIGGFLGSLQPGLNLHKFLAHVAVGFVVFRLMSTVLHDATNAFAAYQPYIYDGNVRLTDYILRLISRSFYYFLLSQPLLAVAILGSPDFSIAGVAGSMVGLAVVFINLFLYSILLGLLGARYPDVGEFMGSIMMAAFLVTPIVWYPEAAPAGTAHGALMRVNPFHHLLASIRSPLLGETMEPVTYYYLGAMTIIGLVAAAVAYGRYSRRVPLWL